MSKVGKQRAQVTRSLSLFFLSFLQLLFIIKSLLFRTMNNIFFRKMMSIVILVIQLTALGYVISVMY